MKRLIAIAVALIAAAVVLVVGTGAGNDHKGEYKVRAIFNNAFTVIKGEDVKISGVKVGSIESLDVTPDDKAAVVLNITDPGFQSFRKDATCTIRPQSLIGERFVECTPTQPRAPGDPLPPPLQQIKKGAGKGQYLLPASQTIKPIDIDLVNNIMRMPYRQRLAVIINELGTGLAANGPALRQAIRNADPALRETDKVLQILASQNQVLADLAKNGDQVLQPLARDRAKVADFIVKANTTAQASAERRTDIERNFQKFPAFLRQLKPTMVRIQGLSSQLTPVLTDLGAAAPEVNRFIQKLGPFSQAGIPALKSLGDAADVGDKALIQSRPLIGDLRTFAGQAKPLVGTLSDLLTSLHDTGGIERFMDFLYYQAAATNGYDSIGHYLRAIFVTTTCSTYETHITQQICSAHWPPAASAARVSRASAPTVADVRREIAAGRTPALAWQDAISKGLDPKVAAAASNDAPTSPAGEQRASSARHQSHRRAAKIALPTLLPGQSKAPSAKGAAPVSPSGTPTTSAAPAAPAAGDPSQDGAATETLLDYLLGG